MRENVVKKVKFTSDFKAVFVMLGIILIILSCYLAAWFYEDYVGEIQVEVAYSVTDEEVVETVGYIIRDEYQEVDGEVVSILFKSDSAYYYPIVSDGTSVAKNSTVAYTFSNEENAQLYSESVEIQAQIEYLSSVPSIYDVRYLDINSTISQINSEVATYIDMINSNDLSDISNQALKFNSQVITKKVIMGEDIDFTSEIAELELSLASLQTSINIIDEIQVPHAGYFVSSVDGYEGLIDFDTVEDIEIDSDMVTQLINSEPEDYENAFGKIIAQHIWYLACNLNTSTVLSSDVSFTVGSTVYVDFTDEYIYQVPMQVVSVSASDGNGNVAVVLKCTYMNQEFANLRIENISFSVQTYEGLRINSDAVFVNEDGLTGVYVLLNQTVYFTPITVLKTQDTYVIATAYEEPEEESDEEESDEEESDDSTAQTEAEAEESADNESTNEAETETDDSTAETEAEFDETADEIEVESDDSTTQTETDESTDEDEEEEDAEYHTLKAYDQIIVKGRNLEHGKIIS